MSGPYEYGLALGQLQRGAERFWLNVAAGFRDGLTPPERLTPEQRMARREAASRRRYAARIANERRAGLQYVRAHAAQVRRELGLPNGGRS